MDWFLLLVVAVMGVAFLMVNAYVLIYFQHDDDANEAYFPKALFIFGLLFTEASILFLPLDVANNSTAIGCDEGWNKTCGDINMSALWMVVFIGTIVFLVILLPFAIYLYEASDTSEAGMDPNERWKEALKLEIGTVAAVAIILVILFLTIAKSHIPLQMMTIEADDTFFSYTDGETLSSKEISVARKIEEQPLEITVDLSFPVFTTGIFSFIGWFFFTLFTGIGLIALPLDLILAFIHRPKFIPADIYAQQKLNLQRKSEELMDLGGKIKSTMNAAPSSNLSFWQRKKQQRENYMTLNKFRQAVYLLENDAQDLRMCHDGRRDYNPLIPVAKLFVGCVCIVVSFLWVLHISLYMLPPTPVTGFLNKYFMWFDHWFPLFGVISVGVFSSYLLACAVKGCFKFGLRYFCCSLHPMELHATYMNSLLFNLALVMLCTLPLVQFCDTAFSDYGRLTTLRTLMGIQIRYLHGISILWEYNVFVYGILALMLLTTIALAITPRDPSAVDDVRKKIEKHVRRDSIQKA